MVSPECVYGVRLVMIVSDLRVVLCNHPILLLDTKIVSNDEVLHAGNHVAVGEHLVRAVDIRNGLQARAEVAIVPAEAIT